MAAPYQSRIRYVADGEPVDGAVANRPVQDVASSAAYLKDRLDAAALGEATAAFGAPLAPEVVPDMALAWDAAAGRFAPALAEAVIDPATGGFVPGPLADVVGVCRSKEDATLGTVVLGGRYATTLAGVAAATPGRYYLSSADPGGLVRIRPPLAAAVLYWDGAYAYVAPSLRDFAEAHVHHRHDLVCRPAGGAAVVDGAQVVTDPDPALPGWLPADHPSFAARSPSGAVFGYNLAADLSLGATWPPQPPGSVVFVWDKGQGHAGGTVIPQGRDGLVVADRYGIWWMSGCAGDAPFPPAFPHPSAGANSSAGGECPREEDMRLTASFTEMVADTAQGVVTDLQPAPGSPLTFVSCSGAPAVTGGLYADIDLDGLVAAVPVAGAVALKTIAGGRFHKGKVVEGLLAGAGVTLTPVLPGDATATADGTLNQGRVRIDVASGGAEVELPPQVVRLYDAVERPLAGLLYLGFPAARRSAIRLRIDVPAAGLPASPTVSVRLLLYGTATGTLPATALDCLAVARPAAPAALPTTPAAVPLDTALALTAGQVVEATSGPISVAAGDTLFLNFTRSAGDGYGGELGVVRVAGILAAGSGP